MRARGGTLGWLRRAVHGAAKARTEAPIGERLLSYHSAPAFDEAKFIVAPHFSAAC